MSRFRLVKPAFMPNQKMRAGFMSNPKKKISLPGLVITRGDQVVVGEQYRHFDNILVPITPPFPAKIRDELVRLGALVDTTKTPTPVDPSPVLTISPDGRTAHLGTETVDASPIKSDEEPTGIFATVEPDAVADLIEFHGEDDTRAVLKDGGLSDERISQLMDEAQAILADRGGITLPATPGSGMSEEEAATPTDGFAEALASVRSEGTIPSEEGPVVDREEAAAGSSDATDPATASPEEPAEEPSSGDTEGSDPEWLNLGWKEAVAYVESGLETDDLLELSEIESSGKNRVSVLDAIQKAIAANEAGEVLEDTGDEPSGESASKPKRKRVRRRKSSEG